MVLFSVLARPKGLCSVPYAVRPPYRVWAYWQPPIDPGLGLNRLPLSSTLFRSSSSSEFHKSFALPVHPITSTTMTSGLGNASLLSYPSGCRMSLSRWLYKLSPWMR